HRSSPMRLLTNRQHILEHPTEPRTGQWMPYPAVAVVAMLTIIAIGILRSSNRRWQTPVAWAVAAGSSWWIATMLHVNPALAASAALLSVSQTASGSLRKAFTDTTVILSGLLIGAALL